ncbi:hypothetical protein HBB16_15210 [Pseudonocardia sp. MCCB 268]|nr:hypothetical protein [Pseudonocardia cytotoxica]
MSDRAPSAVGLALHATRCSPDDRGSRDAAAPAEADRSCCRGDQGDRRPGGRAAGWCGRPADQRATATDAPASSTVLDDSGTSLTLAGATPPFDEHVGTVRLPWAGGCPAGWPRTGEPAVIVEDKPQDAQVHRVPALRGEDFVSVPRCHDQRAGGSSGRAKRPHPERQEFTSGRCSCC